MIELILAVHTQVCKVVKYTRPHRFVGAVVF